MPTASRMTATLTTRTANWRRMWRLYVVYCHRTKSKKERTAAIIPKIRISMTFLLAGGLSLMSSHGGRGPVTARLMVIHSLLVALEPASGNQGFELEHEPHAGGIDLVRGQVDGGIGLDGRDDVEVVLCLGRQPVVRVGYMVGDAVLYDRLID